MPSQIQYIKSAVFPEDYPLTSLPEIAFAGRSNAGKSTLINEISNSKIANVSQQPGKTRLLSFFDVREKYILVDMPGYGFAKRSRDEQQGWENMVENYIHQREQLKGVVLVMDIRRDWTEDEEMIKMFTEGAGVALLVALTKMDKVSKSEATKKLQNIKRNTGLNAVFCVSNLKKIGPADIENYLFKTWVRGS
jgi:GTP-binding protein